MAGKRIYGFDPHDHDRRMIIRARQNQEEALAILKSLFGDTITSDSNVRNQETMSRIAKLARHLEQSIKDLERVFAIPKPKTQPQQKGRTGKRGGRVKKVG